MKTAARWSCEAAILFLLSPNEGCLALRPVVQLGAACLTVLCTSLTGCNKSDPEREVREKFSMRRTDLERIRTMAEEDHLNELRLEEDSRISPAMLSSNRIAEYRSILKRLGGFWIVRLRKDLISIPVIRRGWPVTISVCGYMFVPKDKVGVGENMRGFTVSPLDTEWFVECHGRGGAR